MNGYWDDSVYDGARDHSSSGAYRSALSALWGRMNTQTQTYHAFPSVWTYNWSILQDRHTDPPNAADGAVAQLCYDAAVCLHMHFGVWGSGAFGNDVPSALENHFRYDSDGTYSSLSTSTMTREIQWLRPVEIGGHDNDRGGHAWVVYGYNMGTDPDRQFKMNMGWDGNGDGWYSCDSIIDPNDPWFDLNQGHAVHLAPLSVVRFIGDDDPGNGSPSDPYEDIEEAIAKAPDGSTLIFKAGSVNTFSAATLVIDRPLTLKGYDITIE